MKIVNREFLDVTTSSCHASTMVFYKGKPAFAWFGGTREGDPDSSIYFQYGTAGEPCRLFGGREAHWNPILFVVDDKLFMSYKIGEFCDRWQTFIVDITNAILTEVKLTEAKPKEDLCQFLPAGLNFCVKTKPIIDGNRVYCGSSVETRYDWTSYIEEYEYQEDKGFVYASRSNPLTADKKNVKVRTLFGYPPREIITKGLIQPSIWLNDDKTEMHAYMRASTGLGKIYHSSSMVSSWDAFDFRVWSEPEATQLFNPNSGMDVVQLNGKTYLVYNPDERKRAPLVLAQVSEEHEVIDQITIRDEVEEITNSPELSYPYMIENDGVLHLVYTYGRSKIEHVQIQV